MLALPLLCRERRRQQHLSLRAAGKEMGISAATIHRLEDGGGLDVSTLVAVLRWLDREDTHTAHKEDR